MPYKNNIGDCSIKGFAKEAVNVAKRSYVKSPLSTGNIVLDRFANRNPIVKAYNIGDKIGQGTAILHQTYRNTCGQK